MSKTVHEQSVPGKPSNHVIRTTQETSSDGKSATKNVDRVTKGVVLDKVQNLSREKTTKSD